MKTLKNSKTKQISDIIGKHWKYLFPLLIIFTIIQVKVYKPSLDLNGDNAIYYTYAKSIYQGHGYSNIKSPALSPVNNFPPGYPLLMSLVMPISQSITAQKIFNGILLGGSCLLIYFLIFRFTNDKLLSLIGALLPTSNYLVLHFSTMMMSETSFLFFALLAILSAYKLDKIDNWKSILTNSYFYLMLLSASFAYHIRTQGISLIIALFIYLLIKKKWFHSILFFIGFIATTIPWMLRNYLLSLPSNRYLNQMLAVNHWRPEEGLMTLNQVMERMLNTTLMLVSKAIPNSVLPNNMIDYNAPATFMMYLLGVIIIMLIAYGLFKVFTKDAWLIFLYIVFSCGIITLWSAPSGNRYLVTVMPLMQIGLFFGILNLIALIYSSERHKSINIKYVTIALTILLIIPFYKDITKISVENKRPIPQNYTNFFDIAKILKNSFPKGNVKIANRKPTLFYLFSGCYSTNFASSLDDKIMIENLINNKVDYVVLDKLGFSSTYRYLIPAINKNQDLFKVAIHLKNPDTFLLQFNREKARIKLKNKEVNK